MEKKRREGYRTGEGSKADEPHPRLLCRMGENG
jgi:hypothetical protein